MKSHAGWFLSGLFFGFGFMVSAFLAQIVLELIQLI